MTTYTAQSIVFIDSSVPDLQALLDGLSPGEQAFVIDSSSDGVQQIADILAQNNFTDLSSISIVGHGESGEMELGSSSITDSSLASYSNALAEIGAALAPNGSIKLYGCDVGLGAVGQQFINDFSTFAGGAPVEASTQLVGSVSGGGSWTLNTSSNGTPTNDANAPFTANALSNFQGELAGTPNTEIWVAAAGGDNAIVHVDNNNGSNTASNATTLYNGSTQIVHPTDIALDVNKNLYFFVDSDGEGHNRILEGTLSQAVGTPTATPTFQTLYSDTFGTSVANAGAITGIELDTIHHQIYFIENAIPSGATRGEAFFDRMNYDGTGLTTLATLSVSGTNVGFSDFALDLADGKAFFTEESAHEGTGTVTLKTNFLYVATGVTSTASSVTLSQLPVSPSDTNGIPNFFPSSLGQLEGLDFDSATETIYFATDPISGNTNGGIFSYAINGNTAGNYGTVWLQPTPNASSSSSGLPDGGLHYIDVDPATGKYYVEDETSFIGVTPTVDARIYIGSLTGGTVAQTPTAFLQITNTNGLFPDGMAMDNAPSLSISAVTNTFTEDGASVALITSASASDTDNGMLAGATVSITGGFRSGDTLTDAFSDGTIAFNYIASSGELVLTGIDSFANYQTALQDVEYHSGENPTDFTRTDTSRTLTWVVNDGLLTSSPLNSTVSVLFVNDPPTLSGFTNPAHYTEEHGSVTLSPAASIADPDDLDLNSATVKIAGGAFTGDTLGVSGATSGTIDGGSITVSYNSSTDTLTLTGAATIAAYQTALDDVTFVSGENPTDFGSDTTRTITWVATDPSGTANGGLDTSSVTTTTLSITNVNDPPTLALGSTTAAWTEEQSPAATTLSPTLSITDPDDLDLVNATVSITGGAFTGDQLLLAGQTSGIVISGTNITPTFSGNGVVIFSGSDTLADYQSALELVTYNGGENPTDFGSDTSRTITWTLNDGSGTNAGGVQIGTATSTVSVTFVNDPPTLSNVATTAQYTEEQVGATTLSGGIAVTDPDDLDLKSATISVAGGFAGDGDTLSVNGATSGTVVSGSITVSWNSSTETLTLSGTDTLAHYQTALDEITFSAGENPTHFGSNTTRFVSWTVTDPGGIANGGSDVNSPINTTTVSITNVNDPPTLALGTTTAQWTEEQSPAATTLSPTVSITDADDLDLVSGTVSITGGSFTGDTLLVSGQTSGIVISGTNITPTFAGNGLVVFSGSDTLADYQSALELVTFNNGENPDDFRSDKTRTVTWTLNDGGGTNAGGIQVGTATSTISVTFINDAPTLSGVNTSIAAAPTSTVTLSPSVTVTDADDLFLKNATVSITAGTFAGDGDVLAINGATSGTLDSGSISFSYSSSTEALTLSGTDTLAAYQTALDSITWHSTAGDPIHGGSNPTRTLSWTVQDPSGTANGGFDTSTAQTETLTIDQPPTLSGLTNASWTEEQSPPASTLSPNITISDPDGVNTQLSATVQIVGGTFSNDQDVLSATTTGTSITATYNSSTETLTLTGSDTLANYQSVLDSVTFNAGENPTDFGSNPTRSISWVVTDHVGSASTPVTTTVSITNVNDPPSLALGTTTAAWTEEQSPAATTLSPSITITDADDLDLVSATVSITGGSFTGDTLLVAGQTSGIAIGGTNITPTFAGNGLVTFAGSDTLAHYQQALELVTFQGGENPTDFGSDPTRSVTWTLNDGSGTANGGSQVGSTTSTIDVTRINDAPTLALGTTSASWTEEGANATLAPSASVTDVDDVTLTGATVQIASGGLSADQLEVFDTTLGTAQTSGTYSGINVTYSYNSSTQTLTLSGADTIVDYDHVLDNVVFTSGENPTNFGSDPSRLVTWQVNDGGGTANGGVELSNLVTTTVSLTNVNDPPTLGNVASAAFFTEEGSAATLSSAVSVTDPDDLSLVSATVQITGGTFANDHDQLSATAIGNVTVTYNSSAETLTLTGSDTLAHYQQVLDTVTFSAGENPTDFGSNPTRTVTWTLNDGSGTANGGSQVSTPVTSTISITNVDDAPTLALGSTVASWTEETAAASLSPAATVTDVDNVTLAGATVKIVGGTFANDGDVLSATGNASISVSYNSSTETLTLTGTDTFAHYVTALNSVKFNAGENPTDFGSNATRTLAWQVNDGGPANGGVELSNLVTTTVSLTNVNDPPTLGNVASTAFFTEEGSAATLSSAVSVTDPDDLSLVSATVQITGGTFANDHDQLSATAIGNVTVTYNSSTETLTLTGSDTLAHYQQVLDTVTFSAGENPTDFGSNPTRTVTWTLNDGSGTANGGSQVSTPVTSTISITNVNDAPTLANVATSANYTEEGAAATLSGNVSVTDPDDVNLSSATVKITGGTFAGDSDVLSATTAGTGITASYNSSSETLTLSGVDTLAHYQQVLDSVTFSAGENPTDFGSNPTRTIAWTLTDPSGTANGGVNVSTPVTSTVSITNVNDPPTLSNVATLDGFQPHHTIVISPNVTASDPDGLTLAGATVAITSGSFAGDGDVLSATTTGTNITASYNAANETLTLSGVDTLAHYSQVLDSVTFASGNNPSNGNLNRTRTVSWVVNDGNGSNNLSTAATTTISIGGSVKNDFNGDDKSDLLLQNVPFFGTPNVMVELLNGFSVTSSATITTPNGWSVEATADFNHDNDADIILQNKDGLPEIWLMNGTSVISTVTLPNPGPSWHVIATGDFNGDGNADILWQNNDGLPAIWEMNGTSVATGIVLPDPGPTWHAIGAGDFNGDGKSDILWQNNDGLPVIWEMNGGSIASAAVITYSLGQADPGPSWHAIGTGDFNGDGKADILWQNNDGLPAIWEMNGTSIASAAVLPNPGATWHAIGTSDVNGDGMADIVWQNNDGTPSIWEMNGFSILAASPLPNPGPTWHVKDDGPITAAQQPALQVSSPDTAGPALQVSAPNGSSNGSAGMALSPYSSANGASSTGSVATPYTSLIGGQTDPTSMQKPLFASG